MRTALPALLAGLFLLSVPTAARAVDPVEAGEITAEIEDREKEVKDKFGKPWREMTQEEKKDYNQQLNEAKSSTLKEHGVSARDYETAKIKLGRDGLAKEEDARKAWPDKKAAKKKKEEEEEAKAEAAKKKTSKEGGIEVQRGFDDKNPVTMHDKGGDGEDGPTVQKGGGADGIEIPVPKDNDAPPTEP